MSRLAVFMRIDGAAAVVLVIPVVLVPRALPWGVPRSPALQVRLPRPAFERLAALRRDRCLNVSAWARKALLAALDRDFPEARPGTAPRATAPEPAAEAPADRPPLPGWHPARLPGGGWGAACPDPGSLPDQLVGRAIQVRPRQGDPWTATVIEVVERSSRRVLVRDSGRPRPRGRP